MNVLPSVLWENRQGRPPSDLRPTVKNVEHLCPIYHRFAHFCTKVAELFPADSPLFLKILDGKEQFLTFWDILDGKSSFITFLPVSSRVEDGKNAAFHQLSAQNGDYSPLLPPCSCRFLRVSYFPDFLDGISGNDTFSPF